MCTFSHCSLHCAHCPRVLLEAASSGARVLRPDDRPELPSGALICQANHDQTAWRSDDRPSNPRSNISLDNAERPPMMAGVPTARDRSYVARCALCALGARGVGKRSSLRLRDSVATLRRRYFSSMVTDCMASPGKVGLAWGSRRVRPLTTSMPLMTWPKIV